MRNLKQSTTSNVMVLMVDATDHVTGKTGLTLTITASKDGGAFAAITPTVTERGNGWYSVALTGGDTNTLGDLALHITSSGSDPADLLCRVVAGSLDADVSSRLATSGYTAPPTVVAIQAGLATSAAVGAIPTNPLITTDARLNNLDAAVSSRLATSVYSPPPSVVAIRTEIDANSTKMDVAVSTRLASTGYTAPDNTGITAIKAKTDNLPSDPASNTQVNTRLAALSYIAPDNATIAAIAGYVDTEVANIQYQVGLIKARTDNLPAAPAAVSDVQVTVNGGFDSNALALLQNIEQEALGARTINFSTGHETITRTGRVDKVRTLYKDAAKTQPVSAETDSVLGTGEST